MGAYNDGADVCEMVGLYLLKKIKDIIPQAFVGSYRDDGLAVVQNSNGPNLERIRKKLHKCFKKENLKIEVMINMSEVNFLDVNLNIATGKIKPFREPNNSLQYIHAESNHPKKITKNLPAMIEKRLRGLSSNKELFDEEKMPYEGALTLSGHNVPLKYTEPNTSSTSSTSKRKRRRKVMWYNPPYSKSVSTIIGREFLNILTRNFPPHHKYHKLFNRNNVKISSFFSFFFLFFLLFLSVPKPLLQGHVVTWITGYDMLPPPRKTIFRVSPQDYDLSSTESNSKGLSSHSPSVQCGINYLSQLPSARGFLRGH